MKQRNFAKKVVLLAFALCLCFAVFTLTACGDKKPAPAPVPEKYAISAVDCTADKTEAEKGETITLTPAAKAGHTFKEYSSSVDGVAFDGNTFVMPEQDITVTAVFTKNKYTVVWKDESGNVLETDENVEYGATPTFDGETPTKASTVKFDYSFDGWTPAVSAVSDNTEYTVKFTETLRKYDVVWKNHDGTVIKTEKVEYGTTPEYKGETPEKASSAQYEYEFSGWSPTVSAVDENGAEYTAQFTESLRKYTVTFLNSDGESILQTSEVEYGTVPAYNGLNLSGTEIVWDTTPVAVDSEATYRATERVTLYDGKISADKETADTYRVDGVIENNIAFRYFEGKSDKAIFSADITVGGVSMPENVSVGITATDCTVLDGTFDGANQRSAPFGTMTSTQFYINKSGIATSMNNISWVIRNPDLPSDPDYSAGGGNIFTAEKNKHNLTVIVYNDNFYFYIDNVFVTSRATTHDNISRNDGATHKYAAGAEFMFGIAARETHGAEIVFDNIQGLYGEEAVAKIKADYKYSIITDGEYMVTAKDKTYNVQSSGAWNADRYVYTSPETYAKSAVYSVKITVGNKGSATKLEAPGGNAPILGLRILQKTVSSEDQIANSIKIGFTTYGLIGFRDMYENGSRNTYGMFRNYSTEVGDRWNTTTGKKEHAFDEDASERTLTLVLYEDKVGIYVDGTKVKNPLDIQNTEYFGNACFSKNDSYRIGLFVSRVDMNMNSISLQILTEKYGDEAVAEIQANYSADFTVA